MQDAPQPYSLQVKLAAGIFTLIMMGFVMMASYGVLSAVGQELLTSRGYERFLPGASVAMGLGFLGVVCLLEKSNDKSASPWVGRTLRYVAFGLVMGVLVLCNGLVVYFLDGFFYNFRSIHLVVPWALGLSCAEFTLLYRYYVAARKASEVSKSAEIPTEIGWE